MKQRYYATFPATCGQWAGTHWFFTMKERAEFLKRAGERGADLSAAKTGKA